VLLVDGMWFRFQRRPWVLYNMAVKPLAANQAHFLDPLLLPGVEHALHWQRALDTIEMPVVGRVRALVSDGFRGSERIARHYGWVHQRCHSHMLLLLKNRLGRWRPGIGATKLRESVHQAINETLRTIDPPRLAELHQLLVEYALDSDCPRRLRGVIRQYLREDDAFRSYLQHPELRLPTTICTMEAMHRLMREAVRGISRPQPLLARIKAFLRFRSTIICNGKIPQN